MQSLITKRILGTRVMTSALPIATFATKKGPLDHKEKGDEKVFFDKEDQAALKKLLKKLQDQEKLQKSDGAEKHTDQLKKLFKDHKIDEAAHSDFFEALVEWRKKI